MMRMRMLMEAQAASGMLPQAVRPDLSGTWRLNMAKSFLGGNHPHADFEFTKIVEQRGNRMTQTDIVVHATMMNIPLPDSRDVTEMVFDGREHDATASSRLPGLPSTPRKVSATWQGGTLLVTETGRELGNTLTTKRRYFLSDDGKELIELVEARSNIEDREQRLIFERVTPHPR